MKLVINIVLFIASIFLGSVLFILALIHAIVDMFRYGSPYRRANYYFLSSAVAVDIACNTVFANFLNAWFLKHGGYHFGKRGETVSSALGKNQLMGTLTYMGSGLASILDLLQKDHCYISIEDNTFDPALRPPKVKRLTTFTVLLFTLLLLYFLFRILTILI